MRIGSLFSGAGMLDVAALELFAGSSMVWHSEIEPAACKVLAHHWPDVPNLGDVSAVDWSQVAPVDVLTGGFPCQDVSAAGRRAGLRDGTRSGLWSRMAEAIDVLHPRYVLIENVRGLLSASAVRDMEPGTDGVGDRTGGPVLRALGAVLGDLCDLGFDAEWATVRASDVGACHQRARVFILAHSADTNGAGSQGPHEPSGEGARGSVADDRRRHLAGRGSEDGGGGVAALLPTPQVADVTGGHRTRSGTRSNELLLPGVVEAYTSGALLPTPRATDDTKEGPNMRGSGGDLMLPSAVNSLLPTPDASAGTGGGSHPDSRAGHSRQLIDYALLHGSPRWGAYAGAIERQQQLSRPAPSPTEPNRRGNQRLSARFAEWMMFWPDGWVTDPVIGLSLNEQLRCIGNGVVPVQAVAAFRHLHTVGQVAA